jgi:outer membrane protein OmpA-like peptidoglycan-associated protein
MEVCHEPTSGLRFMVEGHTDNTGSITANNELVAVRDYLIGQASRPRRSTSPADALEAVE